MHIHQSDPFFFFFFLLINFIFLVTHTQARKNAYVYNGMSILLYATTNITLRKKKTSNYRTNEGKEKGKKKRRWRRSTKNDNCSIRFIQHFLIFWFFLLSLSFFFFVVVLFFLLSVMSSENDSMFDRRFCRCLTKI